MIKKEEADRDSSVGISNVPSSSTKTTTTTSSTKVVEVTKVNGEVSDVKVSSAESVTKTTLTTNSSDGTTSSQTDQVSSAKEVTATKAGDQVEANSKEAVTRWVTSEFGALMCKNALVSLLWHRLEGNGLIFEKFSSSLGHVLI